MIPCAGRLRVLPDFRAIRSVSALGVGTVRRYARFDGRGLDDGRGTMGKAAKGRTATAEPRAAGRGAVTLTLPLTVEEAAEFDAMGGREFDCYPVFASLADVVRHYLLQCLVIGRAAAPDSPETRALLDACPASGCACPVESVRGGALWRQCAAGGKPRRSVGRPCEDEPGLPVTERPPAWSGGRGAVTLTMPLTCEEEEEFKRLAQGVYYRFQNQSNLADVVRHEALLHAVLDREADSEDLPEEARAGAPDPTPESSALVYGCCDSGCACPVESVRDGRTWRECAVTGEPRLSAGRPAGFVVNAEAAA